MNVALDQAIGLMERPDYVMAPPGRPLRHQASQNLGLWSDHVLSWLDGAAAPLLLLRYEDLLTDPLGQTARLAAFLGRPVEAATVAQVVAGCRFDVLRATEAAEGFGEKPAHAERFFRQGLSGTWRRDLTTGQAARIVARHRTVMERLGYGVSAPSASGA